jgi:hypothetical protein
MGDIKLKATKSLSELLLSMIGPLICNINIVLSDFSLPLIKSKPTLF